MTKMSTSTDTSIVPAWQDDALISACPICHRSFNFLFRKHHCRRCGQVVCAQCSPHRINLPRQYVVRPPYDLDVYRIRDSEAIQSTDDQLPAYEKVRVCKPCVPDPNPDPPPDVPWHAHPAHSTTLGRPVRGGRSEFTSAQRSPERVYPERYRATVRGPPRTTSRADGAALYYSRRTSSSNPTSTGINHSARPLNRAETDLDVYISAIDASESTGGSTSPLPVSRSRQMMPLIRTMAARQPRHVSGSAPTYMPTTGFRLPGQTISRSRARTSDAQADASTIDDECPVCGTREPPFGSDESDDDARTQHVEECLSAHLQFSTPPSSRVDTSTIRQSGRAPSYSLSSVLNEGRLPSSTASRHTHAQPVGFASSSQQRGRADTAAASNPTHQQRMLIYHATEKDCIDAATGSATECVICLEDFEPGDELGRLECLCKFHRACIRSWWESAAATRGSSLGAAGQAMGPGVAGMLGNAQSASARWGSCPTHTLNV